MAAGLIISNQTPPAGPVFVSGTLMRPACAGARKRRTRRRRDADRAHSVPRLVGQPTEADMVDAEEPECAHCIEAPLNIPRRALEPRERPSRLLDGIARRVRCRTRSRAVAKVGWFAPTGGRFSSCGTAVSRCTWPGAHLSFLPVPRPLWKPSAIRPPRRRRRTKKMVHDPRREATSRVRPSINQSRAHCDRTSGAVCSTLGGAA